jgi:hypothetical protein
MTAQQPTRWRSGFGKRKRARVLLNPERQRVGASATDPGAIKEAQNRGRP